MENVILDVQNGRKYIRNAAKHYNVPYSTLNKKSKMLPKKKHGGQPRLAETTESLLVKTISAMTN